MSRKTWIAIAALAVIIILEFIFLHDFGSHGPLDYPGMHTQLGLTGVLYLLFAKKLSSVWLGQKVAEDGPDSKENS